MGVGACDFSARTGGWSTAAKDDTGRSVRCKCYKPRGRPAENPPLPRSAGHRTGDTAAQGMSANTGFIVKEVVSNVKAARSPTMPIPKSFYVP